jgi:hypothetical protein
MKGVSGEDYAVLQYQVAMAKMQIQHQEDREKIQSAQDIAIRNDARIRELTKANEELKASIAAHHDKTLVTVGAGHDAAGVKRAGITANAKVTTADINAKSKTDVEGMKDKALLDKIRDQGDTSVTIEQVRRMAKENAAAISAGQPPPYPKIAAVTGGGGGPSGAQNPVSVKTPQDAQKLPKGTYFKRPDGTVMVRQ